MSVRSSVRVGVTALLAAALGAGLAGAPAGAKPAPQPPDELAAQHSLRGPVTDENFYFVMADRFENGEHCERPGRPHRRRPPGHRLRPDEQGVLQRWRPRRDPGTHRLHPGARHHVDLADAELQEQARAARGRAVGRLPRLLDHRLHPGRPAPRHERRPARPDRRRARPRDEGLLRHHHEPHRGRDRLRRRAPARRTCRRTSGRTPRPPARRSTTGTTPARTRSHRWTPRPPSRTTRSSTPASRTSRFRPG